MDILRSLTDHGTTRKQVVGSPSSDILSRVALRLEELKVLDVRLPLLRPEVIKTLGRCQLEHRSRGVIIDYSYSYDLHIHVTSVPLC